MRFPGVLPAYAQLLQYPHLLVGTKHSLSQKEICPSGRHQPDRCGDNFVPKQPNVGM
jgi:hypothetical protein